MRRSGPAGTVDLRTKVGSVTLDNPVMTASGTSGHGAELACYFDLSGLGAVVVKSLSATEWEGNPPPRLVPLDGTGGMLNSVGLQNPGVERWLASELPGLARTGARVVASIWGFTAESFAEAARSIADAIRGPAPVSSPPVAAAGAAGGASGAAAAGAAAGAIVAVEANISCPNIEDRRRMFAHSAKGVEEAVGAAVDGLGGVVPVWAKMSPNVTDLPALAEVALAAGAGAVTLINTVMGLAIDPETGESRLGAGGGGLSGPAIHPVAVRAVFECRQALPAAAIVGVGGVVTGGDAAELLAAGADAVQVGTATFADPRAPSRVLAALESWCAERGIRTIEELKGRAHERR